MARRLILVAPGLTATVGMLRILAKLLIQRSCLLYIS